VDEGDLALRNLTYALLVARGRAPTSREVASEAGVERDEVRSAWRRLHELHAVVLDAASGELRMANPFSAIETPYRVHAAGRSWYANCAWDAVGVCAALHVDGRIETTCADCGEPLTVEVRDERPDDESLVFHSLVDAAHWWDDIVFT
jgi:Alkylmercury lyase